MTDKEQRKIALRFLKEMGLYKPWTCYVLKNKNKSYAHLNQKDWYRHPQIDRIFGTVKFTDYLYHNYGIKTNSSISHIFRGYLTVFYPEVITYIPLPKVWGDDSIIIEKNTHNVKLKKP